MPQAIDPRRLFEDSTPAPEAAGADTRAQAEADAAAAGDQPYPVLSSVPDRPTPPTPREIRQRVLEGLVSDRGNARYTDEVVRSRETTQEVTPPPSPGSSAAPAASPTTGLAAGTKAPPQASEQPAPADALAKADPPPPPPAPPVQPAVATAPSAPAAPEPPALASRPDSNPPPTAAPEPPQLAAIPPADRTPAPTPPAIAAGLETPLATIQFAHGSANLDGNDREILRQAAAFAQQQGAAIKVVGHSSGRGAGDSVRRQLGNLEMSISRANAVAGALVQSGMDPRNVIVEAKSDQEPLYRESAATGEAGNRRAELYLIR